MESNKRNVRELCRGERKDDTADEASSREKGLELHLKKLHRNSIWFRMRIRLKLFCFEIHRKLYELRLRLCLWLKPKADCHCCCLICKHFDNCRWEIEQDADV